MKKVILAILGFTFLFPAFANGYRIVYSVSVSGAKQPYNEVITLCDNYMTITIDENKFYLFQNGKGYIVDKKSKKAIEYSMSKNRAFFNAFVSPYGITTKDGSLVFPQLVFKKTKKVEKIGNYVCRKYELPGNFLNSQSKAWFSEKKLRFGGKVFAKYLSFFTKNPFFLEKAENLNSIPIKIEIMVNTGYERVKNVKVLKSVKEINCKAETFSIPKNYKIIKAEPDKIPLAEM